MELRSRKCSINLNKKLKGFPQISCTLCLYNNKGRVKYGYVYIGLIKMLL